MNKISLRKNIRSLIFIILALGISMFIINVKLPDSIIKIRGSSLSSSGQTIIGIMIFALILWITEAIPFHITGLLSIFLLTIFQVDSFKNIVKVGFGSDIFVFFIGVLILSAFISRSGLGRRISVFILSKTGNKTSIIILGFLVAGALLSMWVAAMAVAAIFMPLGKAILEEEGVEPLKSNFGKALMIATAWGPTIGGIATPAGNGANPIAMGFLKDMAGINLTFTDWMIFGVPTAIMLIIPSWLLLLLFFKPEIKTLSKSTEELKKEFKNYPKMNHEEISTVIIFIITVVMWLSTPLLEKWLNIEIPISMPVMFTACLFFLPFVSGIKWKEIEHSISWSGILLIASGISLGIMLYKTGAAEWLSIVLLGGIGNLNPVVQIFTVVLITALLKVIFSSNTVTATVLVPILIALAINLGIDPLAITLPAAITSSQGFILITSSPTNLIPYSAGYFSVKDFAKSGVVITIVSTVIMTVTIYVIGSLTHLY
ncbi:MAG: DASS family sodium-coupled anion symporter [Desulfosporosinus sp.]